MLTWSAVGRAPSGAIAARLTKSSCTGLPVLRSRPLLQGGDRPAAREPDLRPARGPAHWPPPFPRAEQAGQQQALGHSPHDHQFRPDRSAEATLAWAAVQGTGAAGSADLGKVLHGAPDVQQQVFGGAQGLVHREAQEGGPQLRLNPLVQEWEPARALALVLTGIGRLQQGGEGGGRGAWRGRAARSLQWLGGSRGEKDRRISTGDMHDSGALHRKSPTDAENHATPSSPTRSVIRVLS